MSKMTEDVEQNKAPLYRDPRALNLGFGMTVGMLWAAQSLINIFVPNWQPMPPEFAKGAVILSGINHVLLVYTRLPFTSYGRKYFKEDPAIRHEEFRALPARLLQFFWRLLARRA